MNPVLYKRRMQTIGAIDWNAIINAVGQGISIGVGQSMSRQQAEAARGQLQTEAVNVFYGQIVPAAQACQIDGVTETEKLINRFNQACTSLPHASVAASCANIVSEQRQYWLPPMQAARQTCQAQGQTITPTPTTQPTVTPTQTQQIPVYNQAGQVIGYQPIQNQSFETGSNTLPLILLAIGAVLLISR